ncbi:MAG: cytochrome c biogenesis protein ResB, partial [Bdellovibrionales bacterium]|nr:cytochrome c biogenesis protein ResB [Bdellovibrionales bacterium]
PNQANRQIQLSDDELKIQFPGKNKEVTIDLPFVAGAKDLGFEYEGIKLKTFLPFSKNELSWMPVKIQDETQTTSRYRIFNDNFGEFLTLSLHPKSDFNNTLQLGPLNVHYMPPNLSACFVSNTPDGIIIWNGDTSECISPLEKDIKKKKHSSGKVMAEVNFLGQRIVFLPEMSPLPLNDKGELNENSPFRVFSKKLFENKPHLFLFGKYVAFYNKDTSQWEGKPVDVNNEVALPWMGFKVRLLEHRSDAYATMTPTYIKPIQDNSEIIEGNMKALEVEIEGTTFWVTSMEPTAYNKDDERIRFEISKKLITLPYELVLDQFKMDTDPGTSTPASFESFVTLFKGNKGSTKHHIFMNNPLKHEDMTFYQASYFQTQAGPFGSVLSVNFDPGRPWKYLGSLLLVLGSIWHYFLRRKHLAKPGVKNG